MSIPSTSRALGANARLADFYQRHHDLVRSIAWKSGATHRNVDDIVQETFLVARRRVVNGELVHTGWIVKAARLVTLNSLRGDRRRLRREFIYFERYGQVSSSEVRTQQLLAQHLLEQFLQQLPPKQRTVFMLTEFGGFSSPEIGELMSAKPSTIRSLRKRAMADFNKTFSESSREIVIRHALRRDCPMPAPPHRSRAMLLFVCGGSTTGPSVHGIPSSKFAVAAWFNHCVLPAVAALGVALASAASLTLVERPATRELGSAPLAESRASPEPRERKQEEEPQLKPAELQPAPGQQGSTQTEQPRQSHARSAARPAQARSRTGSKATLAEHHTLASARQSMVEGKPAQALDSLRARRQWSDRALKKKALYLELGALCELRRPDDARSRAARWGELHPRDALDSRVEGLCW